MASADSNNTCPHERFFFASGDLYLSVENTLYCVHKLFFDTHANYFPVNELVETSLSQPYILEDVKKIDLDRLLACFYPRTMFVEEAETSQDWISILELASKWGFKSLRSRAISKLEQTLDSPIDMVTLGRQYDIPGVLLPGYAVLCQSTVPLSYEEGLRLGMEDVVNIYRIKHELYCSGITPVPLNVAFKKVKEAGLGTKEHKPGPEPDDEQSSVWSDVESVVTLSQICDAEDDGRATNTNTPRLQIASPNALRALATSPVSKGPEQLDVNVYRPTDKPPSSNEGTDVPSSTSPGNVPNVNSGSLVSDTGEFFKLLDELTVENFDTVSMEIVQWVNTKDIETRHQITRSLLEKAIRKINLSGTYACLCNRITRSTGDSEMLRQIVQFIIQNAIEEPHRYDHCTDICNTIIADESRTKNASKTGDGILFHDYLGEICSENLEAVVASVVAAGELTNRLRRLRLVAFISRIASCYRWEIQAVIEKWVTVLLDVNNEEKVATLCMLMKGAGRYWAHDFNCAMPGWFQRITNVAQKTRSPRVRSLLQDVTEFRRRGWLKREQDII